jgi:hypothetical protein
MIDQPTLSPRDGLKFILSDTTPKPAWRPVSGKSPRRYSAISLGFSTSIRRASVTPPGPAPTIQSNGLQHHAE